MATAKVQAVCTARAYRLAETEFVNWYRRCGVCPICDEPLASVCVYRGCDHIVCKRCIDCVKQRKHQCEICTVKSEAIVVYALSPLLQKVAMHYTTIPLRACRSEPILPCMIMLYASKSGQRCPRCTRSACRRIDCPGCFVPLNKVVALRYRFVPDGSTATLAGYLDHDGVAAVHPYGDLPILSSLLRENSYERLRLERALMDANLTTIQRIIAYMIDKANDCDNDLQAVYKPGDNAYLYPTSELCSRCVAKLVAMFIRSYKRELDRGIFHFCDIGNECPTQYSDLDHAIQYRHCDLHSSPANPPASSGEEDTSSDGTSSSSSEDDTSDDDD